MYIICHRKHKEPPSFLFIYFFPSFISWVFVAVPEHGIQIFIYFFVWMRIYYFTNWRVDLKSFIFSGEDYKSVCFLFSVRALYQYGYRIFEGLNKEAFSMTEKRTRHWMEWEQISFIIWTVMVLEGVPNFYPFRVPGIIISSF